MSNPRLPNRLARPLKSLVLLGLGLFLYARFNDGTLLYYINRRFAGLTFLAAIALVTLGAVYSTAAAKRHDGHGHRAGWGTLLLVALPAILGTLVPPAPLDSGALGNRNVTTTGLGAAGTTTTLTSAPAERDLLDWLQAFDDAPETAALVGQEATLVGFVHREDFLEEDQFMLSRFVIICCVADAVPVGMIVRWPGAADLAAGEWVEVRGSFEVIPLDEGVLPALVAGQVTPTEMPDQPYLYP
jgi:putative membrane protein